MVENFLEEILEPEELARVQREASLRVAGLRLGEVRKRLGLSQKELAGRMGISQTRVSAIETATLRDIKVSTLVAYAEALGGRLDVSIDVDDQHLELASS